MGVDPGPGLGFDRRLRLAGDRLDGLAAPGRAAEHVDRRLHLGAVLIELDVDFRAGAGELQQPSRLHERPGYPPTEKKKARRVDDAARGWVMPFKNSWAMSAYPCSLGWRKSL